MKVEIQRQRSRPHLYSVVIAEDDGKHGIVKRDIPSFIEARRLALRKGRELRLQVFNTVQSSVAWPKCISTHP